MRWKILVMAAVLPVLGMAAVSADAAVKRQCAVNKLRMENEGAFHIAQFVVKTARGGYDIRSGSLDASGSRTIDLSKWSDVAVTLKRGDEVWLTFAIGSGDQESCRKDETRLIYDPKNGNTWTYWTKGSTFNNNRCRFRNNECIPYQTGQ
ncbi:MAG: hypothetical protein GC201_18410 [Alphaproteobacteria bacterium]|nr:hypothetical protein [Alphaproteobacteria bacterium]